MSTKLVLRSRSHPDPEVVEPVRTRRPDVFAYVTLDGNVQTIPTGTIIEVRPADHDEAP